MNVPAVSMTTQASVKPARPVRPSFTVVSTEPHIAAFWCGLLPPRVHGDADTSQVLFTGQQADSFQCDAGSGRGSHEVGGARESHRQVAARAAAVL